jgi:hypothetical protein
MDESAYLIYDFVEKYNISNKVKTDELNEKYNKLLDEFIIIDKLIEKKQKI